MGVANATLYSTAPVKMSSEALEMPVAPRNLLSPLLPAPKVDKLVFCRVKSTKTTKMGLA